MSYTRINVVFNVWPNVLFVLCVLGIDRVGPIPTQTYAQAMTFENGTAYVVGGWGSESQCKVTRISVPEDLCELWSMSKYKCLQCKGCAFCSSEQYNGKSQIILNVPVSPSVQNLYTYQQHLY